MKWTYSRTAPGILACTRNKHFKLLSTKNRWHQPSSMHHIQWFFFSESFYQEKPMGENRRLFYWPPTAEFTRISCTEGLYDEFIQYILPLFGVRFSHLVSPPFFLMHRINIRRKKKKKQIARHWFGEAASWWYLLMLETGENCFK